MFRPLETSWPGCEAAALSFTDQREDVAVRVLEPCRFHPATGVVHVALPGRSGQVVVVLEDRPLALEGLHLRFHISNDPGRGRGLVRPCIPGLVDQQGRVSALEREHAFLPRFDRPQSKGPFVELPGRGHALHRNRGDRLLVSQHGTSYRRKVTIEWRRRQITVRFHRPRRKIAPAATASVENAIATATKAPRGPMPRPTASAQASGRSQSQKTIRLSRVGVTVSPAPLNDCESTIPYAWNAKPPARI